MKVTFLEPQAVCRGCGDAETICNCAQRNTKTRLRRRTDELLREGPGWNPARPWREDISDGYEEWDNDSEASLGCAKHTNLPGIIRDIKDGGYTPDEWVEVQRWLETID